MHERGMSFVAAGVLATLALGVPTLTDPLPRLVYNASTSAPLGFYRLAVGAPVAKGEVSWRGFRRRPRNRPPSGAISRTACRSRSVWRCSPAIPSAPIPTSPSSMTGVVGNTLLVDRRLSFATLAWPPDARLR